METKVKSKQITDLPSFINDRARSWQFGAARKSANIDLSQDLRRSDGVPTNSSPYIIPRDCVLWAVVATTASIIGSPTPEWDATIIKNGVEVYSVNLDNLLTETIDLSNGSPLLSFVKGDKIRLRCKVLSGNIDTPSIELFFIESEK